MPHLQRVWVLLPLLLDPPPQREPTDIYDWTEVFERYQRSWEEA